FVRNASVSIRGGDSSINDMAGYVHSRGGSVSYFCGKQSSNSVRMGGGAQHGYAATEADNDFYQTVVRAEGAVTAASNATTTLYTTDGVRPRYFKLFGDVKIADA
ncbi:MAG: hypothetical protein M3Q73_04200, partial [bacterium]|nr:hypothetical protein [bacterium]